MSKTALLFPGQGAQSVGMGAELVESLPAARELFDRARELLGYDLLRICLEGPAEKLNSTVYSQPALLVTSLAALEKLRRDSPRILEETEAAAGLSLGEYTALVFAGVLDFDSALRVVRARGEAMQEASDLKPSGMVSILGLELERIERLCEESRGEGEVLQVANLLCPGNVVVSGDSEACRKVTRQAEEAGAMKVIPLAVAGAFHTPLMGTAVDRLREAITSVPMQRPRVAVISNVDASPHDDPEEIRELLVQQLVSPVRWEDSMRRLLGQGFDSFHEVGPGRVLRGLLRRIDRKIQCESVSA